MEQESTPPPEPGSRHGLDYVLAFIGILSVVALVLLGLAIVGAFVALGIGMSRRGSNK
jgi:hypothetical protein